MLKMMADISEKFDANSSNTLRAIACSFKNQKKCKIPPRTLYVMTGDGSPILFVGGVIVQLASLTSKG